MISAISMQYRTASAAHFQFGQKMVPNGITVEVDPSAQAKKVERYAPLREGLPPFFQKLFRPDAFSNNHFFSPTDVRSRLDDLGKGYRYYVSAMLEGKCDINTDQLSGGLKNAIKVQTALARVAHELSTNNPDTFPHLLETNRHSSLELAHLNIGVFHLFLNEQNTKTNQPGEYSLDPEKFEIVVFNNELYLLPKEEFLEALITKSNDPNTKVDIVIDNDIVTQDLTKLLEQGTLGCVLLRQGDIPRQFFDMLDKGIREACLVKEMDETKS